MTEQKKQSRRGELRRRWRAMLEDGSIAGLRSEGRLVALYVLYAADFTSCEVRCSLRHAARTLGVQITAVRRGMAQLIEHGIIENLGKSGTAGRSRFVICERAQGVRAPSTPCAQGRAQGVRAPDTQCARAEHTVCAERAQPVRRLRTLCARNSILSSGIPVNTNGHTSLATPDGGEEPPQACQTPEEECAAAGHGGELDKVNKLINEVDE